MTVDRGLTNVVIGAGYSHRHIAGNIPLDSVDWDGAIDRSGVHVVVNLVRLGGNGLSTVPPNNPQRKMMSLQRGYQIYDFTPKQWTTDVKVKGAVVPAEPTLVGRSATNFYSPGADGLLFRQMSPTPSHSELSA